MEVEIKYCSKCETYKTLVDFRYKVTKGLYVNNCINCEDIYKKQQAKAHCNRYREQGYFHDYYLEHLERIKEQNSRSKKKRIEEEKRPKCSDHYLQQVKAYRNRVRMAALIHYGGDPPRCACCNEMMLSFLCIDHIEGGGRKHSKEIKGKVLGLCQWLKNNGYPDGFRILCHNCNQTTGKYVVCPHVLEPSVKSLRHLENRSKVLNHYSEGNCSCCGEDNHHFLCIDHINGGGTKHRRKVGNNIYNYLIKEGFPEGYQILCHNCNVGKQLEGTCPHILGESSNYLEIRPLQKRGRKSLMPKNS